MTSPAAGTAAAVWVSVLPDMQNFGRELIRGAQDAGGRAGQGAGQEMESSFSKAAKGVAAAGAAVGAALGIALVGAMNVEAANDKLAAQLGLTGADAERYGRIAGDLYSNAYGDSLETVNEALRAVTQNIGASATSSDADLQRITASVLDVATAFDQDLGGTTTAVGQLMKNGLAPNADAALDIITAGFQNGADKSGDFLDTLNEYGGQFAKFGLDGATATGLISQGLQAGARDGDLVADAIKEFSIRAIDGSEATAEGFRALGLDGAEMARKIAAGGPEASGALDLVLDSLRAMPDPVQRSQAAVALFGTQAEDLGAALFALDPSSAVAALGDVEGAAGRMGQTLNDNAATNLESFKRQAITAFVDIVGGQILPIVSGFALFLATTFGPALDAVGTFLATVVVPALQSFGQWLRDSSTWLLPLATGIGVVVVALNAATIATTVWGVVTSGASAVMAVARGAALSFQVAVWLLNAAFLANPIGIVVALIAGLVAAFVVAYNTSETFRNFVNSVWESFLTVAGPALEFLRALVVQVWESISQAFTSGVAVLTSIWSGFWATLGPTLTAAWNFVVAVLQGAWDIVTAIWRTAIAFLSGDWDGFWAGIGGIAAAAWNAIGGIIGAGWELVKALFASAVAFVGAIWGTMWTVLTTSAQVAWSVIQGLLQAGWALLQGIFGAGVQFVTGMWSGFWNMLSSVASTVWSYISGYIDTVWQVIKGLFTAATALLRGDWDGFWAALRGTADTVFGAIRGIIDTVWNAIRGVFGLGTTSITGQWSSFWAGLSSVTSTVFGAIRGTIDTVIAAITGAFRTVVSSIGTIWGGIRSLLAKPVNFMINTVYNGGIVRAWNFVAGLIPGIGPIATIPGIPEFASGGPVMSDTLLRAGEAGPEYILSADAVAGLGGIGAVDELHRRAVREPIELSTLNSGKYVEGADHDGPGVSASGFGGVKPHVARAGHYLKNRFGIGSVGGVGARANASDHPKGLALDFMTYSDQAKGDALVNYLLPNAGHFAVKYIIWKQRINSGGGWKGMEDRGSVTANHFDHPHVSFLDGPGGGGGFSGEGGGFLNPLPDMVRAFFDTFVNPLVNAIPGGPPRFLDIPKGAVGFARDQALKFFLGLVGGGSDPMDRGGMAFGKGLMLKDTIDPERVLSPRQTVAFEQLVGMLGSAPFAAGIGATLPTAVPESTTAVEAKLDELIAVLRAQPSSPITVEDRSGNPVETARSVQLALRMSRR